MREFSGKPTEAATPPEIEATEPADQTEPLPEPLAGHEPFDPLTEFLQFFRKPSTPAENRPKDQGNRA